MALPTSNSSNSISNTNVHTESLRSDRDKQIHKLANEIIELTSKPSTSVEGQARVHLLSRQIADLTSPPKKESSDNLNPPPPAHVSPLGPRNQKKRKASPDIDLRIRKKPKREIESPQGELEIAIKHFEENWFVLAGNLLKKLNEVNESISVNFQSTS